jgi:hypothetical protein
MAKTAHYYVKFEPDCYYHVYNRAIDKKKLFITDDNHAFFLKQYDKYLSPVVTTVSYALVGNHFHFGIVIRPEEDLTTFLKLTNLNPLRYKTPHDIVSHQFQLLFQSYAMAFNKQQGRTGTLFQTPFKRCNVDPEHITRLIFYHHLNPQKHQLTNDFRTYPWTSYPRYLTDYPSKLPKQKVFETFGGKAEFVRLHESLYLSLENTDWIMED